MSGRPSQELLSRVTTPTGSTAPGPVPTRSRDSRLPESIRQCSRQSVVTLHASISICCAVSQERFPSRSSYPANSRRSCLSVLTHNPVLGAGFPGSTWRSNNRSSRARVPLPGSRALPCCSRRASTPRDVNATPRSVIEAGSRVGLPAWLALSIAKSGDREGRTTGLDGAEREGKTDRTRPIPAAPRTSARTKKTLGIPMNASLGRCSATPGIRPLPLPEPPMLFLHASSTAARELIEGIVRMSHRSFQGSLPGPARRRGDPWSVVPVDQPGPAEKSPFIRDPAETKELCCATMRAGSRITPPSYRPETFDGWWRCRGPR